MKSFALVLIFCLGVMAAHSQIPNGFTPLFSEGSFDGWSRIGTSIPDCVWKWEGNVLKTTQGDTGGSGWIQYNEKMTDFEFYCEWKCAYNGNSGFFLHVAENAKEPYWDAIEIQICDDPSFSWWYAKNGYYIGDPRQITGALYGFSGGDLSVYRGQNNWNTMLVRSICDSIKVVLNDVEMVNINVNDYTEDVMLWNKTRIALSKRPRTGFIGLQSHRGGATYYRNVAIKKLSN